MDPVGLTALAVCGVSLFTVFAYWRLLDREALSADGRSAGQTGAVAPTTGTDDGDVRCPYCGSENDAHPSVRFCRRCLGRLAD